MNVLSKIYFLFVIILNKILPLRSVPVLLYHSIVDDGGRISVPPRLFESHLKVLKKNNYKSISPHELQHYIQEKKFPRKKVLITFDDGFADNYETALPLLKKYGFTATFFITGKYIGRNCKFCSRDIDKKKYLMSQEQIRQLTEEGFTISNHFYSHQELADLPNQEKEEEYVKNHKILEEIVGDHLGLKFVAYPRNKIGNVEEILQKFSVSMGFGGKPVLSNKNDDIFNIPRISIYGSDYPLKFHARLSPYYYLGLKILK